MAAPERDAGAGADCVAFRLSRRSAWDMILAVGLSGGIVIGILAFSQKTGILPLVVVVTLVLLGYAVSRLFAAQEDPGIQLRLDREGIWSRTFGTIPWAAIDELALTHSKTGHYFLIELHEAQSDRFGSPAALDSGRRRVVHLDPLNGGPSDVRAAIVRFAPHLEP